MWLSGQEDENPKNPHSAFRGFGAYLGIPKPTALRVLTLYLRGHTLLVYRVWGHR